MIASQSAHGVHGEHNREVGTGGGGSSGGSGLVAVRVGLLKAAQTLLFGMAVSGWLHPGYLGAEYVAGSHVEAVELLSAGFVATGSIDEAGAVLQTVMNSVSVICCSHTRCLQPGMPVRRDGQHRCVACVFWPPARAWPGNFILSFYVDT